MKAITPRRYPIQNSKFIIPNSLVLERSQQLVRSGSAGAVGADGGSRGAVADEMDARVAGDLSGKASGHANAAARLAQAQRRQVVQGAAEAGAPEDDIGGELRAVPPTHPLGGDLVEHG